MGSQVERLLRQYGIQQPVRPLSQVDSLLANLQSPDPYQEDYDGEEDEGTFQYLGNLFKYAKGLIFDNPYIEAYGIGQGAKKYQENLALGLYQAGKDVVSVPGKVWRELSSLSIKDASESALKGAASLMKHPDKLFIGLLDSTIGSTLKVLSGTERVGDTPVIATPEERAKAIEEVASLFAMGIGYTKTANALANKMTVTGSKALAEQGIKKTLAKAALTSGVSSGVAGAAGGAVQNLQEDDIIAKTISTTLAGIPLGMVIGTPFEFVRARRLQQRAYGTAREVQDKLLENEIVQEISSAKGLASAETKPLSDILAGIDAISDADKITEAVIRAHVGEGQGWIVPSVSESQVSKLLSGVIEPSKAKKPLDWLDAPKELKISKPTFKGVKVGWTSEFDKAAYILSSTGKKAKNYQLFMDAVKKEFNINEYDVIAHGNYVRQSLKNMISGGQIEKLTQAEFDALNRGMLKRGEGLISKIPEGGRIKDYTGNEWVRQGNIFKAGEIAYPYNDNSLLMTIGRRVDSPIDPLTGKINLPQLEFRPDFRRTVGDFFVYKYNTGVNINDVLISPTQLKPQHAKFFENTGFLPGEVVALDGTSLAKILQRGSKPNTFLVSAVKGKKTQLVDASRLIHRPEGIRSAVKGLEFFEATQETLFNRYIDSFRKEFTENILKDPEVMEPFDRIMERNRIKAGIDESQRESLRLATYRRLQDDFISNLPADERVSLEAIRDFLEIHDSEVMTSKVNRINNIANGNGLYYQNVGGGQFEIRQAVDDRLVGTFGDFDSALKFLSKSYQTPLHSLDLDGSVSIPGGIAELGGLEEQWSGPEVGKLTGITERFSVKARPITPSQDWLHSLAAILDDEFKTGNKFKLSIAEWTRAGQEAAQAKRHFGESLKPLSEKFRMLSKLSNKLSRDQKEHVLSFIETMTPEEIQSKLLSRQASPLEMTKAADFSNRAIKAQFSMQDVSDAIYAARKLGEYGSQEFEAALQGYVKSGFKKGDRFVRLDPEVANIGLDIGRLIANPTTGQQVFSPYLTLRLANAFQFPDLALSRTAYATKHGLLPNGPELQVAKIFDDMIGDVAKIAEIPKEQMINAYVPHIRQIKELSSWAEAALPEDFLHELSRVTIGDNRSMIRDPAILMYRYLDGLANSRARATFEGQEMTYNQVMNKLSQTWDKLSNEVRDLEQSKVGSVNVAKAMLKVGERHLDELHGISDEASQVNRFFKNFGSRIGIPNADTFTNLVASSTQGGRLLMAARDQVSAGGVAYTLFGREFANKAIWKYIPEETIKNLEGSGKIPIVGGAEIASPTATRLAEDLGGRVARMTDKALELSGQHYIYRQRMAGIYLATQDLINRWVPELQARKINKKMFMDKVMIDVHPRAVQTLFDKFISSGDIDGAIKYMSQQNIKRIMNLYGYANSPIGWSSSLGRLLGQYGSWGANNFATALNSSRNLNTKAGAQRMLRYAAYEGAIKLASRATGLNLKSFTLFPFASIPSVGPAQEALSEFTRVSQGLMSPDSDEQWNAFKALWRAAPFTTGSETGRLYLPYSTVLQDVLKGTVDFPQEGYDPFYSITRVFGFRPLEDQQ